MSTDGGGTVNAVLYVLALVGSFVAVGADGQRVLQALARRPVLVGLWLVVAVSSVIGLLWPSYYDAVERRPAAITDHHQYWRLLSASFAQDGGWFGAVFNLVVLLAVLGAAATVRRDTHIIVTFVLAAVAWNIFAAFALHSTGAGNSGPTFLLAASLAVGAARSRRGRGPLGAVLLGAAAIPLVVLRDAHGVAFLAGVVVGLATPAPR